MTDDPNDTLTTIEAKILCLRYGLNNIDASNSVKKLHLHKTKALSPSNSRTIIAKEMGTDKDTVKKNELNALRKLNITR